MAASCDTARLCDYGKRWGWVPETPSRYTLRCAGREEELLKSSTPEADLRTALERHGAREYEVVALSMDAHRGLAALALAERKGVDHPVSYAIKVFDSPDWQPSGEKRRQQTNVHVERTCAHCQGDRFVIVTEGPRMYDESYAPCEKCNAGANTERWVGNQRLETAAA